MPTKRRGGFAPPELRGTLGTLLRTTTGVVRDALERGAREGRARLDDARANRRRHDALADLGELVLDLVRRGEIDLAELPEARDLVRQLDDLDAESDDDSPSPPPRTPNRRRFDDRPTNRFDNRPPRTPDSSSRPADDRPARTSDPPSSADDRPARTSDRPSSTDDDPPPRRRDSSAGGPASAIAAAAAALDSDGTVSSGLSDRTTRPTLPARPRHNDPPTTRATTQPIKALWRDRFEDEPPPDRAPTARGTTATAPPSTEPLAPRRPPIPLDPQRKGGISFDDDLEDYMHPDDVPPKPAPAPADPDDGDA
jgi:hypothetical protein